MAIYKGLPKTNCKECGVPTCMAFAMQVAGKQRALTDCPYLTDEAKDEFSEASAPPMRLIRIGPEGDGAVELGQETVMFRHEEKFHRAPALAVWIGAALADREADAKLQEINDSVFTRAGQELAVRLAAIEVDGLTPADAVERVTRLAKSSRVPFVLMGDNTEVMKAAVSSASGKKPLIYRAKPDNAESLIDIAREHKCPLAIGGESLEQISDLTKTARDNGLEDLVLAFNGNKIARTIRDVTTARRAALNKNFRALGYPAIVDARRSDENKETVVAATFAAKYAGIVIIEGLDPAELLPVLTVIQNIYTDPQTPNTVDAKLYEVGDVNADSPLMFTTNFALTYFSVEAEVERSRTPCYILVIDTEGLGVLNAYAGDKLSPQDVIKGLTAHQVADKLNHRKLIIPGLIPSFRAEIEETSEWREVLIGPENASGIPAFLAQNWN
jgi:acetyl-CoA decarbonylase/synthase complex subunit gamma